MEEINNIQQEKINWWFWFAVLKSPDNEILLYAVLLPNIAKFSHCISDDKGKFDVSIGTVTYCSKIIGEDHVHDFMEEIDKNSNLKFELLDPSLWNKEFLISATRKIIGKTFGKSVVPIKSYYTIPNLTLWSNNLDDLADVLLMLKSELNLSFDNDYARKFGNFEVHDTTIAMDSSLSIELINSKRNNPERSSIRVAKRAPLLDEYQQLHIICREKKDVIYHKLISFPKGIALIELDDLPEDSFELECWVFDEAGDVIFQDHQHYIASLNMNMGVLDQQVRLEDKLTKRADSSNKELGTKASVVNRTTTSRSVIQQSKSEYKKFNDQMMQIQSNLFNTEGEDRWFGKSIECEIEVIKQFQSLLGGGKAKKAIVVDPFFGAEAFERFVTRIEESSFELVVLTSLCKINPDTGEPFPVGSNPVDLLKNSIQKVKDIVNCNLRLVNVTRGNSKQAFHDRYLVVYPFNGLPLVYMLSNSINKMSGNWPFCMSKLEPAIARHVREYIEQLCEGKDNSREGDPNITYEWPENE